MKSTIGQIVRFVLAAVGLALVVACSGSTDHDQGGPPEAIAALHPAIRSGWSGASEFQRDLLRDGDLIFAEYERAVHATVQCLKDAGFDLRSGPTYDSGARRFEFEVSTGSSPGAGHALYDECWMEHQGYLDMVWERINLVPLEQRLAAADAMVACLVEAGFSGMPQPDTEDFLAWSQAQGSTTDIAGCAMQTRDEFSVWFGY